MTTPSLMAYVPGSTVAGMDNEGVLPNWANNQIYSMLRGAGASGGITQFTGYISGDISLAKTATQMGVTAVNSWNGGAFCLCYNGLLICPAGSGANSEQILALTAGNLEFYDSFGATSSSSAASTTTRILSPANIKPMRWGKVDYALITSAALNLGEVCVLSVPAMTNINIGTCDETGANACLSRGIVTATAGTGYVLGRGGTNGALGLYSVSVPAAPPTLTKLAAYTPADIDATWTNITNAYGLAFDQTDNNVIMAVETTDSVTTKSYYVKLSTVDGSIIWKCPIPGLSLTDSSLGDATIKNGTLYIFANYTGGAGTPLYTLNTTTGVATSAVVSNMVMVGGQVSEDINNSIIVNAEWAEDLTVPSYIGTYMGTDGNHTYNGWMRYFPAGATAPLPPAPQPFVTGPPIVSVNRAWTYVLDGHTFYVLDLGAQGTFAYDTVTQQWSNFATGTLNTTGDPQPQWNFQNGCMWGTRIVGCDLTLPELWEMTPASTLDNDATVISHLVTGGISTRSRGYISVDAVRVSASFGQLDSAVTVNFNLRFSDDQEKTWSDYFAVALVPGNYDDEIAWRSLGSFMAPGRIFELSDSGGLIRIDGCDAFLNGFDNDQESQDGSPNQK